MDCFRECFGLLERRWHRVLCRILCAPAVSDGTTRQSEFYSSLRASLQASFGTMSGMRRCFSTGRAFLVLVLEGCGYLFPNYMIVLRITQRDDVVIKEPRICL